MHSLMKSGHHFLFAFIAPLATGASLACAVHAEPAPPQVNDSQDIAARKVFQHAVDAQRAAIAKENAETEQRAPWAGDYYFGDGVGANVSLSLAPRSGVAATWQGCLGTYAVNKGAVIPQADGSLLLKYEKPNDQRGIGFADHVVPVPWGDRMYMLSKEEIPAFASAVNMGGEPRKDAQGMFLMRKGDESRKVYGMPVLPPAQRSLIREVPLEVGVVSAKRLHDDRVDQFGCRYRLELDHGANDGLAAGMDLRMTDGSPYGRVTLEQVMPTRAVGALTLFGDECSKPDQRLSAKTRLTSGAYHPLPANERH